MEAAVRQIVQEFTGEVPLSLAPQTFGHNSKTFDVALPSRSVIVRTNANPQVFAKTEANIAVLSSLGLPVPTVLKTDLSLQRFPFAYMVLDKIPGRDLRDELPNMTPAQMTRLAEQIVGFQQQVATLPVGNGYGWVPIGDTGPHPTWQELVQADVTRSAATPSGSLIAKYAVRLTNLLPRWNSYFAAIPATCFLDDVTVKNVLIENGALQGLIDFDGVCYGDPLYMVSLTQTGIVSDTFAGQERFYLEELCRVWNLTPFQRQTVDLYSSIHTLFFLANVQNTEGETWIVRLTQALENWLTALENRHAF